MQRKTPKFTKGELMGRLPFQEKVSSKVPTDLMLTHTIEAAKAAFPIFGGTEDDKDESPSASTDSAPAESESATAGGDSPTLKDAEVPNLEAMTPEKIAELLKNVTDLSSQVTKLTAENNNYKSSEQKAERAKQTREQQLEQDVIDLQQTVAKMDAVIRHTAVVNAIQGAKDIEFHSARHVMNELASDAFDLDVDLDNGTATVSGIDGELKRIAKEMPWLVSKDKTQRPASEPNHRTPRASGNPPPAPGGANDKQTRRAEMINKYPVIAHGRAG